MRKIPAKPNQNTNRHCAHESRVCSMVKTNGFTSIDGQNSDSMHGKNNIYMETENICFSQHSQTVFEHMRVSSNLSLPKRRLGTV